MILSQEKNVGSLTGETMTVTQYSSELAEKILRKFNDKGWNLYKADMLTEHGGPVITVSENLADKLEQDAKYVLLPVADKPKDYDAVMKALFHLSIKLRGELPTITVLGERLPLLGVTLGHNSVKLHTPSGDHINYAVFVKSLDSIVQTR